MIAALSLLAGVLLGLASAGAVTSWWPWCGAGAAALAAVSAARQLATVQSLLFACVGMVVATLSVGRWQELQWPRHEPGSRLLLEGVVRDVPARDGAELRFDAEVRIVSGAPEAGDALRRARLSWRNPPVTPRSGERWRWLVRLSPASGTQNFAGFEASRAGMRERIHFAAQVVTATLTSRKELAPVSIDTMRARIATRIAGHVADPEAASLLTALAVGSTSGMSTDQWRVFNATGTTHLVAISGLHVTLFAAVMFFLARRAWGHLPPVRGIAREPFALTLGLLSAAGYSLLAGFSVPTQRTLLMLSLFAIARLCARHIGAAQTWSLAMIGVLLLDGFAPLDAGFWLSFVAVGVILAYAATSLQPAGRVRGWLGMQWAVSLALAPLTFVVFGSVSVVGLLANLVAIPVMSFVLVPLVLAGAVCALAWPLACGPLFALAAALHDLLWPALVWAADLDVAVWRRHPTSWWLVLSLPAALLWLLRWPWALRASAAAMALPLLFAPSKMPAPGAARVWVLDAGRGSAALVLTRHHALLFDTGDDWNTRGSRAVRVVIPAMDALGLRRLDRVILPRLDEDRARGTALLALEREVARVLVGGHWQGTSLPVRPCRDESYMRDGVTFEVFAAGPRDCALRVAAGPHAILLGGGLDARAERALLSRLPAGRLASDVVLMGRGASPQASSREWIETSAARVAIAAGGLAGSASRAETLGRWRDAGIPVLDTLYEGDIEIALGMQGFAVLGTARTSRYPFAWRRVE